VRRFKPVYWRMNKKSKIFVAGGQSGLVGTAIVRSLRTKGYTNIILKTRKEVDLLNQKSVEKFFARYKPEYVFLAAAKVGGIVANNTYKADFIYDNIQIQTNVIYNAWKYKVKKLMFLGSSCIYPRLAKQPIKEEYFMTGPLEPTNDAYAVAKIAGIKMCQSFNTQYRTNFISVMPTNLYGPNDNFDLNDSHVLPAMIRKFHEAKIKNKKEVILWGNGSPRREFLYVDDMADACVYLMEHYSGSEFLNIGCGKDQTIKSLAMLVKKIVGYKGKIHWDKTKPNGMPRKQLDVTKLFALGWKPKVNLEDGIRKEYEWFLAHE
jgi:GDP-L-fucose synthase